MNTLTTDLLRAIVSSVMNILLLFSLAKPKYNKRVTNVVMLVILVADVLVSVYFYLARDLTALAKYSFPWFILLYISLKPLFLDSLMQWLFNLITVINVYAAIVVLSFHMCYFLPYPPYAVTFLRFLLFAIVILLFRYRLRPLYRQALARWNVFILLVAGVFINNIYYFMNSSDIELTLTEQFLPMTLLILLAVLAYVCIFYSLKVTSEEYALREENIKMQAGEELLREELSAYEEYINISRQYRHDMRHHNALIRELLNREDINAALAYLKDYDDSIVETVLQQYCSNSVANAIFRLYEHRAQADGIDFAVNANIPNALPLTAPELGGILSNLLENAWESCRSYTKPSPFIAVFADTNESQFLIEIKNNLSYEVLFRNGLPVSTKESGGTGTKSIIRIVQKHSGMCRFKQSGNEFIVQIIIPLQ